MKKLFVALLTVIAISSTQQIVKADTIDKLQNRRNQLMEQVDRAEQDLDKALDAECSTKCIGKRAYTKAHKYTLKCERTLESLNNKLDNCMDKYDAYMEKHIADMVDVRVFAYVNSQIDNYTDSQLTLIATNYCEYVCADLGISTVNIKTAGYNFKHNVNAVYVDTTNTIYLNLDNIDRVNMFNTIAHECRHAWQHCQIEFEQYFGNYVTSGENYTAYTNQLVEKDARAYGATMERELDRIEY